MQNKFEGRLVNVNDVIEAIDKHTREDETLDEDISVILEEVKTAFDEEKVIDELNDIKDIPRDDSAAETISTRIWNRAVTKSIKIVERGGIE